MNKNNKVNEYNRFLSKKKNDELKKEKEMITNFFKMNNFKESDSLINEIVYTQKDIEFLYGYIYFLNILNKYLNHFPRHEKYALSQTIRNSSYDVFNLVIKMKKKYYNKTTLTDLDITFEQLKLQIHLAYKLGYFAYTKSNNPNKLLNDLNKEESKDTDLLNDQYSYTKLENTNLEIDNEDINELYINYEILTDNYIPISSQITEFENTKLLSNISPEMKDQYIKAYKDKNIGIIKELRRYNNLQNMLLRIGKYIGTLIKTNLNK